MEKRIEQTLVILKPDALLYSLAGSVLTRISDSYNTLMSSRGRNIGVVYSAQKVVAPTRALLEAHYSELKGQSFFNSNIDYMMGLHHYTPDWAQRREIDPADLPQYRRLLVYAVAGDGITDFIRNILGPRDPAVAKATAEGSIRAQHGERRPVPDPANPSRILAYSFCNIAHASTEGCQERELKLWFKPSDFSHEAYRRPLGYTISKRHYYLTQDRQISQSYSPGSLCLVAPGDMAWQSDLDIIEAHIDKQDPSNSDLPTATSKYELECPSLTSAK